MEVGRHRGLTTNEHIAVGSNSYEKVETFYYVCSLLINMNSAHGEIKCKVQAIHS